MIDPMLSFLGWSWYSWANATGDHNSGVALAYTTIKRYMNGTTRRLRGDPDRLLRVTLQNALQEAAARRLNRRITRFIKRLDQRLP